jgi:glycosyltransferase involved in cell wall biosynthesis
VRILQLISSTGFYGAERMICLLSSALQRAGIEVYLGVFNASNPSCSRFIQEAQRHNLQVLDLACKGRWDLSAVKNLSRCLRSDRIDVLHTHGYKANIYGLPAASLAGCSVVATCHNWTNRTPALRQYAVTDRLFLRRFDRVVAVSHDISFSLRRAGVPGRRIRIIANGVEVAPYQQAHRYMDRSRRIVLGCLSRLSKEKGVDVLLWAMPKLLEAYPDLQCVVAGEGPERERLQALAVELGVSHAFHLPGFCEDTPRFLAYCTMVVQPSRIEAMPLAVLEAMASGKAIVASAVGEIPRLLDDGDTGVLVSPENPEMLSNAILALLDNPARRHALERRASEKAAAHFDVSVMAKEYARVYQEAIARRRRSVRPSRSQVAGACP